MIRLREYIPQLVGLKRDGTKQYRTVPIGNSLAPWRTWLEDGETGSNKRVDRLLDRFELFNLTLRAELGVKAKGLVRSWRRF
jgi:hypothetical protein